MTNGEKYLKAGVSVEEFLEAVIEHCSKGAKYSIETFLNEQIKPTLTEDERVILRNISNKRYTHIARGEFDGLRLLDKANNNYDVSTSFNMYEKLFQFIKERRRIFY